MTHVMHELFHSLSEASKGGGHSFCMKEGTFQSGLAIGSRHSVSYLRKLLGKIPCKR